MTDTLLEQQWREFVAANPEWMSLAEAGHEVHELLSLSRGEDDDPIRIEADEDHADKLTTALENFRHALGREQP